MKYPVYIFILLVFVSCEKQIDWPMSDSISPRLVVEGFITNNPDLNYVRLSLPVLSPSEDPIPITGAEVAVVTKNGPVILTESSGIDGCYIPETNITGVLGEAYVLYIKIGEYEFLSRPVFMAPVYQIKNLIYHELDAWPGYYVIKPANSNEPSMIEYRVKYENPKIANDSIQKVFYSYTLRTIDVNQFFKPDMELLVFPKGATVVRTKYSLAPGHERYIRGLLNETEWKGSWFDLSPGNLYTNMSAGAVGYFGACSVLRDTIILQ